MINFLKALKNEQGFTLFESILAVGLLSVSSLVTVFLISNILNSAVKSQASIDLEQTANFVLSKLNYDLQDSYAVYNYEGPTPMLVIKKKGGEEISYTVEDCNVNVNPPIKCIRRNGVPLNDYSSDFVYPNSPSQSSVGIRQNSGKPYFDVIYISPASGKVLGVNLSFEFYKPNLSPSYNFGGSLLVDTTVVLNKY